jgi:hypothetical protein
MRFGQVAIAVVAASVLLVATDATAQESPAAIGFARQIRPILVARCSRCHGSNEQEAGLRLDIRTRALAGGDAGAVIIPGAADKSELIQRISADDDAVRMPPEGARLSKEEIALLRAWIDQGATWPDQWAGSEEESSHWAFQQVERPPVPVIKESDWVKNEIDPFVIAQLREQGIQPSPEADRSTLIRRLSLDIRGLPPTLDEVDAFLHDPRPNAYEHLVEKFLASPHYGERWGRHWLDLARYADSSGYEADTPRTIWPYRDWVINALNRDLPFDRFVVAQLAGDLLPDADVDQRIATGFHCNAIFDGGLRWEAVIDRVNTTGTLFLGLTLGCAQCHSHKTDPLTQREYYELYAFFNTAHMADFELATPHQKADRDALQSRIDKLKQQMAAHESSLAQTLSAWEAQLTDETRRALTPAQKEALATAADERNEQQTKLLIAARLQEDARRTQLAGEIDQLCDKMPVLDVTPVMKAAGDKTHIFMRGNHDQPGEAVSPGVPAFLPPLKGVDNPTRLDFARWLVAPENPLTARVTVNRFWQRYFHRGLVETENDFGVQTPPPSHPQLLDWLAAEFVHRGWSLKAMHRLIVCSATYRQASRGRRELAAIDPGNRLLARQSRFRLEAEILRDSALAASGLLSTKLGGPSVFPFQPSGVLEYRATKAEWKVSPGEDRFRRGLYTWFWRLTPHPMLVLFDAPDGTAPCTRRDRSNTPVQALTLLNDPMFVESARAMARRMLLISRAADDSQQDRQERLRVAFRLCTARNPRETELQTLTILLADQLRDFSASPKTALEVAGPSADGEHDAAEQAAWVVVCRTLLNLDEFVSRE